MKNRVITLVLTIFALTMFHMMSLLAQDIQSGHGKGEPQNAEPAMGGIHWAKGQGQGQGRGGTASPNLRWNGGPIMGTSVVVTPIFWGGSWGDSSFVQDKIDGLIGNAASSFYGGFGGSSYAGTNTEYTSNGSSTGTHVTTNVIASGYVLDLSAAPSSGSQTAPILTEVCSKIASPVSNGYYPVYVDTPRGHAGFCAWHSASSCKGVNVQFAFFFNLDGDPGCDPGDTSGLHSQGLAAVANVSGHELSEAVTDPRLNAWYDSSGSENSDKCAWAFGTPLLTFSNGSQWMIQGNWSNAAYNAGAGYLNRSGQKGCLDGGNYK